MTWTEFGTLVGIPILRSGFGWAEKAFADGKIEPFEIGKLIETTIRIGVPTTIAYFGINAIPGMEIEAITVAAAGFIADQAVRWIKKLRSKE